MVEKWPLKTVETNTALCRQVPGQKLPVYRNSWAPDNEDNYLYNFVM